MKREKNLAKNEKLKSEFSNEIERKSNYIRKRRDYYGGALFKLWNRRRNKNCSEKSEKERKKKVKVGKKN